MIDHIQHLDLNLNVQYKSKSPQNRKRRTNLLETIDDDMDEDRPIESHQQGSQTSLDSQQPVLDQITTRDENKL